MTQEKERKLFVRTASGLVREVSTSRAMFFNLASMTGAALANIAAMGIFPGAAMLFGLPPISVGHILAALACVLMGLIFVVLVVCMPRSGGDYVFSSRIMHPFLGWIETWTLLWANLSIIGYELMWIRLALRGFLTTMGAFYGGVWADVGAWLTAAPPAVNQFAFGGFLCVLIGSMALLKARTFHTVLSTLCVIALSCVLVFSASTLLVDPNVFASNLQTYLHVSEAQVQSAATQAGMDLSPLAIAAFPPIIAFALWDLIGFQYSGYIAGELKGNLKRNSMIAMLGVLGLYLVVLWIVFMLGVVNRFGYQFVSAWGYLFYNAPGSAPLGGIAPIPTLYGLIGRPDLWPFWMVLTIGIVLITFSLMPAYLVLASRIGLAWSMDRVVPAWFSKVNVRTHSPLRVYFIMLIGGWIFDIATIYGLNPLTLAWYSTLLCAFTWIFPGFNALLMPFRRKDLYESSPWKMKILSLPVVSLIGLAWLIFIVPIFTFSYFQPIISQVVQSLPAGQLWSYTASSGLTLVAIITGVGVVLYALSYWYNKTHGVDVNLIFKQIPPE